jgi:hypothetical protein
MNSHHSRAILTILLAGLLGSVTWAASGFSGTWVLQSQGVTITLALQEDSQGNLTGTVTGKGGYRMRLEGMIQDGVGVGACRDDQGAVFFEAHLAGDQLDLYLIEPDSNNMPDSSKARKLPFVRQGGGTASPPAPGPAPAPGRGRLQLPDGQPLALPPGPPSAGQGARPAGAPPPGPAAAPAAGGPRVTDEQLGFSFVPPAGWKVQKQPQGYLLGSDTLKGFILVTPHNFSSLEQIRAEASQGLVDAQSGIQLMPAGGFQPVGANGLAGEFSGMFQGQMAKAYSIALLSPQGGGVTVLAAVTADGYTAEYPRAVQSIAASVQFAPAQAGGGGLMQWIAGKYWSYSSSGGYSSERTVHLCPDGRYFDSAESSASGSFDGRASGSDWGTASQSQGVARWKIRGSQQQGVITILYPDGTSQEVAYQATGEQGVFMIEGRKYAYAGPPNCN